MILPLGLHARNLDHLEEAEAISVVCQCRYNCLCPFPEAKVDGELLDATIPGDRLLGPPNNSRFVGAQDFQV